MIVANGPRKASSEPVVLGGLWAEYENAADKTEEAIRLDAKVMLPPANNLKHENPIADATEKGTLSAAKIAGVRNPDREVDGTHCLVTLADVPDGAQASVWVSLSANGDDALRLANNAKNGEVEIRARKPWTDFCAFVGYAKGKETSKPSAPFKFSLKREFGMR